MRVGILPLGRATFDVAYASEMLAAMVARLEQLDISIVGSREMHLDSEAARASLADLTTVEIDCLLVLQVTFTDAAVMVEVAGHFDGRLAIWAPPEPRLGGRLRLNAFCGLNLASHALGLTDRPFSWLYAAPERVKDADLVCLLTSAVEEERPSHAVPKAVSRRGRDIAAALNGSRIARVGDHPDGFDTCAYDAAELRSLTGIEVEEVALDRLFETARAAPLAEAEALDCAVATLAGIREVDQDQLDRSLRLKIALDQIRAGNGADAFAIRCWPETFTEYGGAICGPVSMLGEAQIPCACEADVYGAATQLLMQRVADAPVFLVDLVDIDVDDDTGVVWHCGQAPLSMADPGTAPEATLHTNRKMPLLYQFALKPGRVTLARISQSRGAHSLVLSTAEILARPMAFSGTSGVLRFDRPASAVLASVIDTRLEHHMCLSYGDHADTLAEVAGALGLPVVTL